MMNCKQVQKLLPLSLGRDLEESCEQMVAAHLQFCLECVDVAKEFREIRQLLREYESPAISDDVYAEIRRRVLCEIEAESTPLSAPQLVTSLFRPRLAWALASALLIISMFAIYFTTNRRDVEPVVADKHPATVRPVVGHEQDQRLPGDKQTQLLTMREPRVNDKRRISIRRFQPRKSPDLMADRGTKVVGVSENPVRVEIQTSDPNIRIIWFSQPNNKPDLPSWKSF